MSEAAQPGAFATRTGIALVAIGAALFVALLWMIGMGWGFDDFNDGGGHAGGKGLNGFAGLVRLAATEGWTTTLARDDAALDQPGLLVLTPAVDAPGKEIARIVSRHRRIGPVLVIGPKWLVQPLPTGVPGAKRGWVTLAGVQAPNWPGFLDKVSVAMLESKGSALRWRSAGLTGRLPSSAIEPGSGTDDSGQPLVPLVRVDGTAKPTTSLILAAYVADARRTPALDRLALDGVRVNHTASSDYPLVMVFEPDLLDNYGLADPANAALASRLLAATAPGAPRAITFDLTLDGLGHAPNLLTLAFTPPYLAATSCLILAALAAGWRSFVRFGSPVATGRQLAFGKARLVENSGALILRARRLHLLGPPYAAACRDRITRALALPRNTDIAQTDARVDRALAAKPGTASPGKGFAEAIHDLQQARGAVAIVAAAQALHELERRLNR